MKKTLLLLALAASVGFAYAADEDTTDKTLVFSNTEAAANATLGGGGCGGIIFSLSDTPSRLNATLSAAPELTEIPSFSTFDLQSVGIMVRSGYSWDATAAYILDDASNTVLAHSTNSVSGNGADTNGILTFNFADVTLQAGAAYRLIFVAASYITSDVIALGSTLTSNFQIDRAMAMLGGQETSTVTECGFSGGINTNNATTYAPVVTITAVIPEPATATLSLLALAGLAARRRRH